MATGSGRHRMIDRKSHLVLEQTLHGYSEGHELLASSSKLPREARRMLLSISDLSGHGFIDGFDGYLTGYPLPTIEKYALGRTWYAPEMSRLGCVWTHTLLVDFGDIAKLDAIRDIVNHFQRPTSLDRTDNYEIPLKVEVHGMAASVDVTEGACMRILDALYGERLAPVFVEASHADEYNDLVFAVWAPAVATASSKILLLYWSAVAEIIWQIFLGSSDCPKESTYESRAGGPLGPSCRSHKPRRPCHKGGVACRGGHGSTSQRKPTEDLPTRIRSGHFP